MDDRRRPALRANRGHNCWGDAGCALRDNGNVSTQPSLHLLELLPSRLNRCCSGVATAYEARQKWSRQTTCSSGIHELRHLAMVDLSSDRVDPRPPLAVWFTTYLF